MTFSGAAPPEQICGHGDSTLGDFPVELGTFSASEISAHGEIKLLCK